MRVLVVAPSYAPGFKAGGVQRSVTALVETAPEDVEVLVVTSDRDTGDEAPYDGLSGRLVTRGRAQVLYVDPSSPRHWRRAVRQARLFAPDVLYLNSLWNRPFGMAPAAARALGVLRGTVVVVAPRGQLNPGALATGSRLKPVVMAGWRAWAARPLHVVHCSDQHEVETVRQHLPGARCLVSLDPVQLPATASGPVPRDRPADAPLEVVMVSRIARNKGQATLVSALAGVTRPVRARIIGPPEDASYVAELMTAVASLPAHVEVEFTGAVAPGTVRDHVATADVFAFPTLGENFGHVIPEALSVSCPVLAGSSTPFTSVLRSGGGAALDPHDVRAWTDALDRWAALSPAELAAAHARAGAAYGQWISTRDSTHVFDLFRGLL